MTRLVLCIATLGLLLQAQQDPPLGRVPQQTRSMVITRFGIVATSQTLASQAGAMVLEHGGNAVDAAIAANATLGVVQPGANGIGGDLFAIVYEAKSGKLYGLNSSGWTPAGLTLEFLRSKKIQKLSGIHTVTVPGAVAGWDALRRRLGKLPFSKILAPAIYYAQNGHPAAEMTAAGWKGAARRFAGAPNFIPTWTIGGRGPNTGEMFRNPDLAASLTRIAEHGRDGFYRGPTAEAIVRLSREMGGTFEPADLEQFQPEWIDPVSTIYRGWTVWELPPNGHGIAALSMLNMMERFPLAKYGHNSAKALHVMIEAKKLAYADLLGYAGDPKFSRIPVKGLISKELAASRAKRIEPDRAQCAVSPSPADEFSSADWSDTIYMSAIDRDGNIVSLIQSLSSNFGTGFVPPQTGFALHNRGSGFELKAGLPNSLGPRKRPLHTIIPAFMEKDGVRIGFGIMGGWNQAQAHAQFVSNLVDFGLNIQAALDEPRFTKLTFPGCDVSIESRIPEPVRKELTALGHEVKALTPFSGSMGRGQAVLRDRNGVNYAASDPRGDGSAVPEGPPVFQ
ncbi:MAG TPA: gamma-glutamyltransferase [Bryobacteraceae bacterium]|nr:gamma-glutamyltransferase [Bryobacteraceae bacterium]